MKLKKYSLHTTNGTYLHFTTNSLSIARKEADKSTIKVNVNEKYIQPSPFTGKPSEHFKTIYANY